MKNIYLLSNLTKTSVSRRLDAISLPSRCRVMPIILLFLTAFSLHAWGAEDDAHDFSQSISQGLNNCATFDDIVIAEQTYPVKSVIITYAYNKSNSPSATVSIGSTEVGTQTFTRTGNLTTTNTLTFTPGSPIKGAVTIVHNSGSACSGSQKGTLNVTNVRLIEGASASCANEVTITKGAETNGTYTLSATSICGDAPGGTVNISDITPASGYEFDEITTSASGTVDNTNKRVTGITANTTITVKFKALPTYAIRFFNNGVQVGSTQNLPEGAIAVKPSAPAACDEGYTFVGWWTGELAEDNTIAETWITDFTVSGAQDYYAVFSVAGTGGGSQTFDFASIAEAESWSHNSSDHTPVTQGNVTISVSNGTYNGRWYNGTYRVYAAETITITCSSGDITSVTSDPSRSFAYADGNASSSGVQTNFTSITVNYGETYYTTDCGSACSTPTLTFDAATINKFVGDAAFRNNLTITGNTLGADLTYTSSNPSKATVDGAGNVTILDAMSNEPITITARLAKKTVGLDCQKAVQASYTLNIYNRVTWAVNGAPYTEGDPTQQAAEGGTITAYPTDPDGATACGGKVFVGWTNAPYAESDAAPDPLYTSLSSMSSVHITENTTFYAVFAEETLSPTSATFSLVNDYEADFESGKDYVLANYYDSKDKALNATVTGTYYLTGTDVTIPSSNTFQTSNGLLVWKIKTEGTNQVSLYNEETGKYAYLYHPSGTYYNLGLRDDKYLWTISHVKETGYSAEFTFTASDYSSYILAWDNSNSRYAAKTSNTGYLYLYKKADEYTYAAYSTTCGPNIKAGEVELLTSTLGQTVKSQEISVRGSSLAGSSLSVKSTSGDIAQFSYTFASQTITDGVIETTFTISYTPNVYDATHTAEIIFWDGTTESDPITLRGRSLPKRFAIVAYDGANYYALDGSMTGTASSVRPMPVTVNAGVVENCPERGIYSLTDLDTPDQNVHLTSTTGRLYGEGGGTGLNIHSFTSTSGTGWLLTTTDFVNYHVTNATTTSRGIMYSSLYNSIGHYNTINYGKANYYGEIQFLPYTNVCTCLNAPQNVTVVAKATKAIITWDEVESAIGYEVSCVNASTSATEGSISIDAVNHTATITGLTNLTNYNFTVKAVSTGNDCSLAHSGHFKTTNCDDVPYGIRVTPAINSATFKWSMESATATIRLYSDEECTIQVGSDHTGLTSPATITGLAENTQYYAKIFAGGICESGVIDFMTNSPSVEIAEWFPDSIRIIIDAGADASVIIEDKQEHGSSSGTVAEKVFISKYFEADGNNKMIAIFNGTLDTVDITNYWLYRSEINANEKKFCLKNFGKTPGKIAPNEEIIIMRFTSDNDAAIKCAEAEENFDDWNIIPSTPTSQQLDGESNNIYQWLQFSGPQSIGLYDNNPGVQKFIDVIGATTSTGELVQIEASNKIHCSATKNSNNDGSGFFADGKNVKDGSDIVLSTNRCLLIRKNTVVSGENAVATNVYSTQQECSEAIGRSFQTLGEEWLGFIIGKGADAADKTCEGLAYVGGFDYSGYYTTYDSIGGIKDLTGQQNDDGTYTIPIPELDTLSCSMMRIKVYEGGVEKASREYQVPIMVEETKTTTDTIFQNKWHDLETCKTCDVVILKGATLTKAENGLPKDAATVGNLTIYPGGTMNIPNSRTFNVASVQFRVEGENVPFIKLSGTLYTSDQQVLVSRRINNSDAYFFSLPYDCNISDIRWSNGEPAVLDNGFRIKEYDSRARADEGSTKGAPGHWKMVTGSTLEAGKGYQISVNSKYLKELIFPLDLGKTNVSDAENEKAGHGDNVVPIHQYLSTTGKTINNENWNFIAQPYLCAMDPMTGDAITYGYLDWKVENDEVVWERKEVGNQYLTIYDPSSKTYTQKFWSAVSQLDPFLAFFVQGKAEGTFTFVEGNRLNNAPARHLASQAEVDEDPSIFVGVTLSGNGLTDQANLRVRQDFTEDEYKLGYDLLKFTTYYKDRPQVYMKTPSYQLAFQAVNDSVAKNTFLPMGVYCYKPGTYTFGLSNDYPIDEVEAVYLYDKVSGVTTNLLYDTYTITTSSQLYTNTRFALNVIVNRRAPQVTTDIGIPEAPDNMVRKILINSHVYIQRGAAIYDITGKQMLNF